MEEMKTLTLGGKTYAVRDAKAARIDDNALNDQTAWSGKHITDAVCPAFTEAGSVVTCAPVAGYPLGVESRIEPVQAGVGDPYPPGGGKNLIPPLTSSSTTNGITFTPREDGSIVANGTATANAYIRVGYVQIEAGVTYTLSGCVGGSGTTYQVYMADTNIKAYNFDSPGATAVATGDGSSTVYFIIYSGTTVTNLVVKPQLEVGNTATDYAPYSNIRPINGRTSVKLWQGGKNLAHPYAWNRTYKGYTWTPNEDGSVTISGASSEALSEVVIELAFYGPAGNKIQPIMKANTQYTLSVWKDGQRVGGYGFKFRYIDTNTAVWGNLGDSTRERILENVYLQKYNIEKGDTSFCGTYRVQLEEGTIATEYEPYRGKSITMELGQTVYGGSLNWQTGVLTVTHGNLPAYAGEALPGPWISGTGQLDLGAQVVYALAEPITIQLLPTEILAVPGENVLCTDTGGTEVSGRADPTAVIEKLTQAIIALGGNV